MARLVFRLSFALLLACSPLPLTVSHSVVPDSGPSLIRLMGLPAGLAVATYDDEQLSLQRTSDVYRVELPQRPPGRYALVADDFETEIQVVPGHLSVHVLDVGQGDATLIQTPAGEAILVDSGPPEAAPALREALDRYGVTALDLAVATHMDADHIGGFPALVAGADGQVGTADDLYVGRWRDSGDAEVCTSQACDAYRSVASGRQQIEPADDFERFGGFELETLARAGEVLGLGIVPASGETPASTADDNARSVVLELRLNGFKMLLMGDVTGGGLGSPDVEGLMVQKVGRVDVLRGGHHGSRTSNSQAFVAATAPRVSLLSFGDANRHCHPVQEVVERLGGVGWVYGTNAAPGAGCPAWTWPTRGGNDCGDILVQSSKGSNFTVRCAGGETTF